MNADIQRIIAAFFGSVLVPSFEFLYGEGEVVRAMMTALLFFIVLDWISGIRAAKKDHSYTSEYGIDGVFRTFFIILLPAGGHLLDKALGAPSIIFGLLVTGILYHVIQSMTANAIRAGWGSHFPEWLLTKLTDWVRDEIEAKIARAERRREEISRGQEE